MTCAVRLLAFAFILAVGVAAARDLTPAQQRMKTCNTQAKARHLEGAMRNRFMSACLNGDGHARAPTPRQQLHEQCNERARGLEGAERRGFMTSARKARLRSRQPSSASRKRTAPDYMKGCLDGAPEASR